MTSVSFNVDVQYDTLIYTYTVHVFLNVHDNKTIIYLHIGTYFDMQLILLVHMHIICTHTCTYVYHNYSSISPAKGRLRS